MYLSFGEQVKIVLKRKGMTIKELAEIMEARTGKKMSRQNLTQRLGRDNFQEKDMRLIADILECSLQLNMLDEEAQNDEVVIAKVKDKIQRKKEKAKKKANRTKPSVKGEIPQKEVEEVATDSKVSSEEKVISVEEPHTESKKVSGWRAYFGKLNRKVQPEKQKEVEEKKVLEIEEEIEEIPSRYPEQYHQAYEEARDEVLAVTEEEDLDRGDRNPYTGREYESNSVRIHPSRIGYVQVYSRKTHSWKDMTEWAFLGEQERLKAELGRDYQEPIYLD